MGSGEGWQGQGGARFRLPCDGVPVACVSGAGLTSVATDLGEWVRFRADGETMPPAACLLPHSAAMMGADGGLLVSLYDSLLARLSGAAWSYLQLNAPALCLCAGSNGAYAGTADGAVIRIDDGSTELLLRVRDPVIALEGYEAGLLILGSRGMFGRVDEPVQSGATLQWLETASLGRLSGFFTAVEAGSAAFSMRYRSALSRPAPAILPFARRYSSTGFEA